MRKIFLAITLFLGTISVAHADFQENESVLALTENDSTEVLINESFFTDALDAETIAEEIVERMDWDEEKVQDLFSMEEKGDSVVSVSEEWFAEAGLTGAQTEVEVILYFQVDTTDYHQVLDTVYEELEQVTLENVLEHLVVYEKDPDQSTVYGSIIISDWFTNDIFSDVTSDYPYYDAVAYVYDYGIVQGYDDGTYRPENEINRAEFTKILLEAKYPEEMETASGSACFTDVDSTQWYAKYVCFAKENHIVDGYDDGSFKPGQSINIAEALKITLNVFFSDIPDTGGEWYEKYWDYAYENGLLLTEWQSASENLSRGAMAEEIFLILN